METSRKTVNNLINCLTDDEDFRQELWVHYLDGNTSDSLALHLEKIQKDHIYNIEIQGALWRYMNNYSHEEFTSFLANFTDFEQSVIFMLILGLDASRISECKGINVIRIKQVIATIGHNPIWNQYGIKGL